MKKILTLLCLFCFATGSYAQCYQPRSLDERLEETEVIAVGQIVRSVPEYDRQGHIVTRHLVAVDLLSAAGEWANATELTFLTRGGTINEERELVSPSLRVSEGADGLFLLRRYRDGTLAPAAVEESFLPYDPVTGQFLDGGRPLGSIADLTDRVATVTGRSLRPLTDRAFAPVQVSSLLMPVIGSITPTTARAGVGDIVTINGNGFGSTQGTLFVTAAAGVNSNSFTSVPPGKVLSWTNNSIQFQVPSRGATGRVLVQTSGGLQDFSSQTLTVRYAITNLDGTGTDVETPRLVDENDDGSGGYTLLLSNNDANNGQSFSGNAAAVAAFQRAVSTWQQQVDYNIRTGGTTSIQVPARDNVSVVGFGNANFDFDDEPETSDATTGIAFSYYSACNSSLFELTEVDIFFRRNGDPNNRDGDVDFNFGPGPGNNSTTDFESVALHEIGHTVQLRHVNNANSVMRPSILNGSLERDLGQEDINGAIYVLTVAEGYTPPGCSSNGEYFPFSQVNGLPVELTAFTARPAGKIARLDWATATENNSADFEVQHSTDGNTFTGIGRVAAAGNSLVLRQYAFEHLAPASGSNYYRLSQRDLDGSSTLSDVRLIEFDGPAYGGVFPNPVRYQLTYRHGPLAVGTEIEIIGSNGALLRRHAVANGSGVTTVPVEGLPAGVYTLRAGDRVERFIIR